MKRALFGLCLLASSFCAAATDVTVAWDMADATGVGGYEVGIGTAAGTYTTPYQDISTATARTAIVTGLSPGSKYYISVRARNAAKTVWSAWSNEVPITIPLSSPSAVTVTVVVAK